MVEITLPKEDKGLASQVHGTNEAGVGFHLSHLKALGQAQASFQLREVSRTREPCAPLRESGEVTNYPTHVWQSHGFELVRKFPNKPYGPFLYFNVRTTR